MEWLDGCYIDYDKKVGMYRYMPVCPTSYRIGELEVVKSWSGLYSKTMVT